MTFWPSPLPSDPMFDGIVAMLLKAAADRTDKEWKDMSDKPSGVAEGQAAATDIGRSVELEARPAAWATFYPNGSTASVYSGRLPPHAEPLYRQPPLTEAERRAIGVAIQCVEAAMAQRHPEEEDSRDLLHKTSCTLSGLLERTTL